MTKEKLTDVLAAATYKGGDAWVFAGEPAGQRGRFVIAAVLAELDAAGFAVVPVEPTEAMLAVLDGFSINVDTSADVEAYRALLAAAPTSVAIYGAAGPPLDTPTKDSDPYRAVGVPGDLTLDAFLGELDVHGFEVVLGERGGTVTHEAAPGRAFELRRFGERRQDAVARLLRELFSKPA